MGLSHYLISSFTLLGLVHVIKWVLKNFQIFQWTPRSIKYAWNIPGPTQIYGIGNILQFVGSPGKNSQTLISYRLIIILRLNISAVSVTSTLVKGSFKDNFRNFF